MAKTKHCRNGKMKKYNKTQKYVKSGGVLSRLRGKKKQISLQLIEPKEFKSKIQVPLYPIINTLNGISQENDFLLNEKLEELFNDLTKNIFDINKIKKTGKYWCSIHEDTLREYKEFKNILNDRKLTNPSLVSLIDEIHKKFNEFEEQHNEYKDGYCSDGPLPPTPDVLPFRALRPRASTPQAAAPSPPPRGIRKPVQKPGSGEYAKLGSNRMTRKTSTRKPSTLKTLPRKPYEYSVPISVIKAREENSPYENASQFRMPASSKNYNPFDPTNPFYNPPL